MADDLDRVPLTAAITGLRKQIRAAAEQASKLPPGERFRITGVELELQPKRGVPDAG